MLPLLGEVVTDMGKGEKPRIFGKLLDGVQMLPLEKDEFVRYYFENRQDQNRKKPFAETTPEQDRKFWRAFTDEFGKYMVMRYRLSGAEGARQAFFPGKDGGFTQVVTRNIFDLAYRITNDFERARIEQLIKKEEEAAKAAGGDAAIKGAAKAATDRGLLAAGKLKLIMVNGVEQYRSEKEIKDAAALKDPNVKNMKVTPASAVGLGKMKDPAASAAALEIGAGISAQGGVNAVGAGAATGAGAAAGAAGATAGGTVTGAEETAGFDELQNDFAASSSASTDEKYEKLVSALAAGGLTIAKREARPITPS